MLDVELAHERDYVAGLYARLDELRQEKMRQLAQVRRSTVRRVRTRTVPNGTLSPHFTRTGWPS